MNESSTSSRSGAPWYLYPIPLLLFFAAWYLFTLQADRQFIFSSPANVWSALLTLLSNGELLAHTRTTLFEAICGFVMGTTAGALLGLGLWYSKTVASVVRPYIAALASVPIFALSPMIITWFGIGIFSKVMLAFLSTVVVAMVQSYQGAMTVQPRFLRLMAVVGADRSQIFRFLVVPSSAIWVINAMKLNIGLALLGAFIGEFISAEQGLGHMIVEASGIYDMATVFVGVGTLMVVALTLSYLVELLEKRLLRWQVR
jgi:ABC-type nitrate/sulfonate/bicarbonate transport system, permease component